MVRPSAVHEVETPLVMLKLFVTSLRQDLVGLRCLIVQTQLWFKIGVCGLFGLRQPC